MLPPTNRTQGECNTDQPYGSQIESTPISNSPFLCSISPYYLPTVRMVAYDSDNIFTGHVHCYNPFMLSQIDSCLHKHLGFLQTVQEERLGRPNHKDWYSSHSSDEPAPVHDWFISSSIWAQCLGHCLTYYRSLKHLSHCSAVWWNITSHMEVNVKMNPLHAESCFYFQDNSESLGVS